MTPPTYAIFIYEDRATLGQAPQQLAMKRYSGPVPVPNVGDVAGVQTDEGTRHAKIEVRRRVFEYNGPEFVAHLIGDLIP